MAHGFEWAGHKHPWLRYFELAVGYGSRGYQPETASHTQERNFYYGISLNISRLLDDTLFRNKKHHKSLARKITKNTLEYLQAPGTALLFKYTF